MQSIFQTLFSEEKIFSGHQLILAMVVVGLRFYGHNVSFLFTIVLSGECLSGNCKPAMQLMGLHSRDAFREGNSVITVFTSCLERSLL